MNEATTVIRHDNTDWWWEALRAGSLEMPVCKECAQFFFPVMPRCPHCSSDVVSSRPVSGLGRVYSWVTIHLALDPQFEGEVPYTVVSVALDEGPRLFGRFIGDEAPVPSLPVQASIYAAGDASLAIAFRAV